MADLTILDDTGEYINVSHWYLGATIIIENIITICPTKLKGTVVVVIIWQLDYNYLCNQCQSPLML